MSKINSNFKFGFTLAEVLITLVIVGVVAALTIPTAINNTKEQELKSQFAKSYSTISQALYKTEMNDFYGYAQCYYGKNGLEANTTECGSFFSAFAKNLQVQKSCLQRNGKEGGCVPTYQSYSQSDGCAGFSQNRIDSWDNVFVLADGQIIITYNVNAMPVFLMDINGHKGPNAYGKDLFSFKIERTPDTGLYTNSSVCGFPVQGGKSTEEMIKYSLAGKK